MWLEGSLYFQQIQGVQQIVRKVFFVFAFTCIFSIIE
jgi:hypothetical protein